MSPKAASASASRVITHISLIGFATSLSARAVDPIIPPIAESLAVEPAKVALLSTAFALPFALMQPVLGPIADMIGKVRLMIICLSVIVLASLVCALATSYPVLLAARIVVGAATGGIFPVGLAIIGDAVPVAERQVAIGRWLAVVIGGNLVGAALAGMIGDLFGWRGVFIAVTACGAAAFVNAMLNLRQAARAQPARIDLRSVPTGYRAILANPRAKFCFLAVFLEGVAVFGLFPFVALLLLAAGEPRASIAGLVIAGFSIGGVIYSLSVSALTRAWQPHELMIGGGLVAAAMFCAVAFNPPWPIQLAAFVVLGVGFYCLHGSVQVESTELSTTARGAAMALHSLFFFLGHAAGPALYGIAITQLGATRSVLLGGLVMLATGLMCARYLRRVR